MVTTRETCSYIRHVTLLDLDDDCLELILRYLNLLQQFQISRLHTRFKQIVQSLWRKKLRLVALHPDLLHNVDDPTFVEFMLNVGPHMDRLLMRHINVNQLRLLSDCVFPQTQFFDWMGLSTTAAVAEELFVEHDKQFTDEDVNMLLRIFPNLKVLKLRSCQITGKYLAQFASLQQLSLDECQCLDSEHFREIFQNLKLRKFDIMDDCDEINCCDLVELKRCPSLEHIKIADYHLCFDTDIVHDILRMPRLRKLSIYSKNFVFDVIERISRSPLKSIEAFKFNGVLHNFERFFRELAHMRSLRKLAFHECRGYDIEGIRDHMLSQLSQQLPDLREIHFCACDLESEEGLLHFLRNCPHLQLINVSNTHNGLKDVFVWRCIDMLRKQRWRTSPLELWIKGSAIDPNIVEDPRCIQSNRLLKFDVRKSLVDSNPPGVLKFTFAP